MQNQNNIPNLIIKGKFLGAYPSEQRGQYTIRKFAVDASYYNSQNGSHIESVFALEFFGDKGNLLDEFKKGDNVIVRFNMRTAKDVNTGKWRWVNISPWKIERDQEAASTQATQVPEPVTASVIPQGDTQEEEDDLPF